MPSDIFSMTCAIARGDEAEFNRFHEAYSRRMYAYVFSIVRGDEAAARDIHGDALLRAIRYMKPFEEERLLWLWLVRLMRTAAIDSFRKGRRYADMVRLPAEAADAEQAEECENDALGRMLSHLSEALKDLPDEDRLLLEAHYFGGRSQVALAAEAAISPKAIGMRFARLRERLKIMVSGRMRDE